MNPIGIMQGRLSPPVGGRIQSFPVDFWRSGLTKYLATGWAENNVRVNALSPEAFTPPSSKRS